MLNQLARYGAVIPLIEEVSPATVLEVGSGSEGLARFVADRYEITASDHDFSDYGSVSLDDDRSGLRRVQADVTDLPFADREFDVVLALDLLEHIPPEKRRIALSEMARVSGKRLITGCPSGEEALQNDRTLARIYDRLPRRERPVWLNEHLENGFPEVDGMIAGLDSYGSVRVIGNERLRERLIVATLEAIPLVIRPTLWLAAALQTELSTRGASESWRARVLRALRGGDRAPAYRKIVVVDRPPTETAG